MTEIARVSETLQAQVAAGNTPGCVAVLADAEGVIHESAHGLRAEGGEAPMTVDSVFRLFSMTKAIGTAAALKLPDQGRLDLDAPVADILPEFAALRVFEGWAEDGAPRLRDPARPATVRQLATHTSGLVYDIWNADQLALLEHYGVPRLSAGRRESLPAFPLHFDPGERWAYGVSTDWLGLVVEAVAGEPIRDFLRREILGPLDMHDTDVVLSPDMAARLVAVHTGQPGARRVVELNLPEKPDFFGMGHALHGTGPDYARFLRMILRGGELDGARVLSEDAVAAMRANAIGDLRVAPQPAAKPDYGETIDFFPEVEKTHTLGFMRVEGDIPGRRRAGSLFWAGVMNSHFWIDPAANLAGVLMMQQLPFLEPGAMAAFEAFERAAYALRDPERPAA
ncbi:MAG: serine hydrolase domain-containing protein [Pseudomonadota bacterium]